MPQKPIVIFVGAFMMYCISSMEVSAQQAPSSPPEVVFHEQAQILLHEVFRLGNQVQGHTWPDWSEVPFAMLLVTPDYEFLVHHPRPSDDFGFLEFNEMIGDSIFVRKRQFPPHLRATFPAVGGLPTIVMGLPNADETPAAWVLTSLHEHFHQWQMSRSDYYSAVNDLGLAKGDNSGQWMLNYPFPYDSTAVHNHFGKLTKTLKIALEAVNMPSFDEKLQAYIKLRQDIQRILSVEDYRYLSFQIWQEGVARYVEYKVSEWAANNYEPTVAFSKLEKFQSFDRASRDIKARILRRLTHASLRDDRRTAFYPLGAAEALLLDEANPGWHQRYWTEKFQLESLF